LRQLKVIDISVPPIEERQTTEHRERWSICHLLATLTKHNVLEFPINLIKRDRPDFCLDTGKKQVGIEITRAIPSDYARAQVLPEVNSPNSIVDPSLVNGGSAKKPLSELRSIASKTELTGPGWKGNEIEDEWSHAIADRIREKTEKLKSKGFTKFSENWLLIYDDITSCNIDESCSSLMSNLEGYWSADTFDKILVESGDLIIEIIKGQIRKLALNDIWKR